MDDNFASIVVGVEEGRVIFDNLTKTIAYTVTHMLPEVTPILMNLAFGFPLGLSAILILTIDLFTEMAPAVSLAYEPAEADVMNKRPRNAKTDRLVTWQVFWYCVAQAGVIETLNSILGFFLVFRFFYGIGGTQLFNTPYFQGNSGNPMPGIDANGNHIDCQGIDGRDDPYPLGGVCYTDDEQNYVVKQAQTCWWAMLTCCQVFHIWMCKTRNVSMFDHGLLRNDYTLYGVVIEICLIILIIFPPSSNTILFSQPFPPRFWALIVISPFVLFCWQEGRKWYVRHNKHSWIAEKVHW